MSALPEEAVQSVSGLIGRLRGCLEKNFAFVMVRGEITDLSRAPSGHIYFSLKDSANQIKCAWFNSKQLGAGQLFDPLTGEVFENPRPDIRKFLRNGTEAICAGTITFYGAGGICQLSVDFMELAGDGALAQAFEEMKKRLAAAGYFETSHKRPLPANPVKVALITSPHGAAIHDFLEISQTRGLSATIRLFPTPVQGAGAAKKIASVLKEASLQQWAEVIVLIRGGGSLEDLWAFNEEIVCQAIYDSAIPVLTGIGHEIDVSLADLTADVRAATPSHAAQLLWQPREEIWQKLDGLSLQLANLTSNLVSSRQIAWERQQKLLELLSPGKRLKERKSRLAELNSRLDREFTRFLELKNHTAATLEKLLGKFSPAQILAISETKEKLLEKNLRSSFSNLAHKSAAKLRNCTASLQQNYKLMLAAFDSQLNLLEHSLAKLNPEAPFKRGYALLMQNGKPVYSADQCKPGQIIEAHLVDGVLTTKIEKINLIKDDK